MTYRVRERLRRYLAKSSTVREETALRDGSQKTKTLEAVADGGIVPAAEGDTRVPRTEAPATTPVDTKGV